MKIKNRIIIILAVLLALMTVAVTVLSLKLIPKNTAKAEDSDIIKSEFSLFVDDYGLDLEFYERRKTVQSNVEISLLLDEFAEKWETLIDDYYQKIIDHYSSAENADMVDKTKSMKSNWENYRSVQMHFYEENMNAQYRSGSTVSIKNPSHRLVLARNKAIELYILCQHLLIEVDRP